MNNIFKRFTFSLFTNLLRAVISFTSVIFIAKHLGPSDFGRMTFLLSTFVAIKSLLDMGTSSAFFTFLSKNKMSSSFILNFWLWILLQFAFSLTLVAIILPESAISLIWRGESRFLVCLALVAAFMQNTVWPIATQMAEANRQTINVQVLNVSITITHFLLIVGLWFFDKLNISLILILISIEWSFAGFIASKLYKSKQSENSIIHSNSETRILRKFILYCLPFVPYAWLGFACEFADRWILQTFGGKLEQAYYGIAAQFASISLIATASVTKVLWKEIAELNEIGDIAKFIQIFTVSSRALFVVTAFLACFLVPCSDLMIDLFLGSEYKNGVFALSVMFLYPIHQSLGQITATMFYALGFTYSFVMIGIFHSLISITLAYLVMAPSAMFIPGLALGSLGLSIKMVLVQLLMVNISLIWLSKKIGIRYELAYQVKYIFLFLIAGFISRQLTVGFQYLLNNPQMYSFIQLFIAFSLYLTLIFYVSKLFNLNLVREVYSKFKTL